MSHKVYLLQLGLYERLVHDEESAKLTSGLAWENSIVGDFGEHNLLNRVERLSIEEEANREMSRLFSYGGRVYSSLDIDACDRTLELIGLAQQRHERLRCKLLDASRSLRDVRGVRGSRLVN